MLNKNSGQYTNAKLSKLLYTIFNRTDLAIEVFYNKDERKIFYLRNKQGKHLMVNKTGERTIWPPCLSGESPVILLEQLY